MTIQELGDAVLLTLALEGRRPPAWEWLGARGACRPPTILAFEVGVTRGIVEAHGGTLVVETLPPTGLAVHIRLPLERRRAAA
jgi:hypothetical protein